MAERRRRRAPEDEGEELIADKNAESKGRPSECESEAEGDPADADLGSEYESAAEDSKDVGGVEESEEGSEEETEEETEEEEEEGEGEEGDYTDDDVIVEGQEQLEEERQSGDGEEQPNKENVDDDEDKKNPAYVPRKGAFYEHDMRTGDEDVPEKELKPKKKLWQDEGKWSHDRFRVDLQAPKSREELVALYGYDIRVSDKAPEAPPPRRGRGRGRGKPQRTSQLSEFIEPEQLNPPPPEPEPPQPYQRMAVIDTTDSGKKRPKKVSPRQQPEVFEDFEEDIEVPFMTTIDTSKSSANDYHFRGQRQGRETGQRGRRDRGDFADNRQTYTDIMKNEQQMRHDDYRPSVDKNRGRGGNMQARVNPPQDVLFVQKQDSPRQESYSQDFPSLGHQDGGFKGSREQLEREHRSQKDFRNQGRPRADAREEEYSQQYRNIRGGSGDARRGGFNQRTRGSGAGNQRNDRNNRPPRYGRIERFEDREENTPGDLVPAAREFTNSSYRAADAGIKDIQAEGPSSPAGHQTSQDVVISNKENVQTISVTITNTTTERKSYAKERRGNSAAGASASYAAAGRDEGSKNHQTMLDSQAALASVADRDHGVEHRHNEPRQGGMGPRGQQQQQQEQSRPKRYSSQRQRNMMELGYGDPHQQQQQPLPPPQQLQHPPQMLPPAVPPHQQLPPPPPPHHQPQQPSLKQQVPMDVAAGYFKPGVYPHPPQGHPAAPPMYRPEMAGGQLPSHPPPPTPQDAAAFSTAMLQPPLSFRMPVTSPGIPSPQHLMAPAMAAAPLGTVSVPISNPAPQLIPAPYLAGPGVIYTTPPPLSGPYQVPLGYTSPPPTAPPPTLAQTPVVSPQSQPEVHRGGTVYFPPYLQQPSQGRSPARRPKVAIPIVDPTELKKKNSMEGPATPTPEGSSAPAGHLEQPEWGKDKQLPLETSSPAAHTELGPATTQTKPPSEEQENLSAAAKAEGPALNVFGSLGSNTVAKQEVVEDNTQCLESTAKRDNISLDKTTVISSSLEGAGIETGVSAPDLETGVSAPVLVSTVEDTCDDFGEVSKEVEAVDASSCPASDNLSTLPAQPEPQNETVSFCSQALPEDASLAPLGTDVTDQSSCEAGPTITESQIEPLAIP